MFLPAWTKSALLAVPFAAFLASAASADTALLRGVATAPVTLDPHLSVSAGEADILRDLYEGLTIVGPDGKVQPGAASRWAVNGTGLIWAFTLRDAKWSNGEKVTAADFVRAFRRLADRKTDSPHSWLLRSVVNAAEIAAGKAKPEELGVMEVGPNQINFTLVGRQPMLPLFLSHPAAAPIHASAFSPDGSLSAAAAILTNGPFRLADWHAGAPVNLMRNANFRDAAAVTIDTVSYETIGNTDEAAIRIAAGTLHTADGVPIHRLAALKSELGERVRIAPYLGTYFLALNVKSKTLAAPSIRRALSLAIDRTALADGPWGGTMVPATSLVPAGIDGYAAPAAIGGSDIPLATRVPVAQALLAGQGVTADKPLKLTLRINSSEIQKATADAIVAGWKAIGVEAEIVEESSADMRKNLARGRFDAAALGWIGDYADPDSFLSMLASGNESLNFSGYDSDAYDALLTEAAGTADVAARDALFQRAEKLLADDMPVIPLLHYASASLVAASLEGWQDNVVNAHPSRYLTVTETAPEAPAEPVPSPEVTATPAAPETSAAPAPDAAPAVAPAPETPAPEAAPAAPSEPAPAEPTPTPGTTPPAATPVPLTPEEQQQEPAFSP